MIHFRLDIIPLLILLSAIPSLALAQRQSYNFIADWHNIKHDITLVR